MFLSAHLGTQLLGILFFSITRWRRCPGCRYAGGAGGLGSGTCPARGSSALSFSALKASLFLILWWNSGPLRADIINGRYRTPMVLGGYFFHFFWRGFTYISDNSFSDLRSPSLDQRSQAPDNCTVSEIFSLRALPGAFLYLIFWGCCFPQSRCMAIFL